MLFLLTNNDRRALLMAHAGSQEEADTFGRNHLPEFCGESVEIEPESQADAEEFWGVRTVRVVNVVLDVNAPAVKGSRRGATTATSKVTWIRGPRLPEEVESADLLTPEDHRELTLDHIARTSAIVGRVDIRMRA